jgi:hypothetical protein
MAKTEAYLRDLHQATMKLIEMSQSTTISNKATNQKGYFFEAV